MLCNTCYCDLGDGVVSKVSCTQQTGVPGATAVTADPALLLASGAMATPRSATGVPGVHMQASVVHLSLAGADSDEFGPSNRL